MLSLYIHKGWEAEEEAADQHSELNETPIN